MSESLKIYTIPTCSDCNHAKRYFAENNIPYIEYNCEDDMKYPEEVFRLTGKQTVPTIVIQDKVFVGFADNFTEITKLLQ
ncbi:glutaredoxin family protein [Paenibacillus spongiae]|uniref:Glutaredoxin family protein n=1 Tax=Paenibacillus spongiae TaxID=2909671 RepID=A0ABY5S668_9BACL|nr:glutaredoxin domain-containing protein [Paenibacillus spongiae]UVI29401.1 glutaredoxin family protein [Paenibacillus spongiae]